MTRQELFTWIRQQYGTEPEYPWQDVYKRQTLGDAEADPEETFWYSMTAQTCGISTAHGTDETVCALSLIHIYGKAFTIEKVGLFDVELRDPDSVYPIFRSRCV